MRIYCLMRYNASKAEKDEFIMKKLTVVVGTLSRHIAGAWFRPRPGRHHRHPDADGLTGSCRRVHPARTAAPDGRAPGQKEKQSVHYF